MNFLPNRKQISLPVLPVKNITLLPFVKLPFAVGRAKSVAAIEKALLDEDRAILVVAQRESQTETPTLADLYSVGTKAIIRNFVRRENGFDLILEGLDRVQLEGLQEKDSYLLSDGYILPLPATDTPEFEALHRTISDQIHQLQELAGEMASLTRLVDTVTDKLGQIYFYSAIMGLDIATEQKILESDSAEECARLLHEFLTKEIQIFEIKKNISSKVQTKLSKQQREYLLRQQLEAIQKELGDEEEDHETISHLRAQLAKSRLPDLAKQEAERELRRLERMNEASAEYQLLRSYIELLCELPWEELTEDQLDLDHAREILDKDHYDIRDVKDRIIEHIATMKLNPQARAPVLCFVGPPGVGKTSLGESIARALGRKFERMSLGGLHDESELRGHRRTYIGAMPGRIIQALRRAGSRNPVLMLDEVDKLGRDFRGDPSAAMMEILDPSQNSAFKDNYLDLPFDLSHVFFILTANSLDPIPAPLLDRMEVIKLSGYSDVEKLEIANRYLLPNLIAETGFSPAQVEFSKSAMLKLIHLYTREAGLRQLSREIGRLLRKIAVDVAKGKTENIRVESENLATYLGSPKFLEAEKRKTLSIGEVIGLAWTPTGGDTLTIEAILLPGGEGLTLTGQLGDVMKESARAAHSYLWSHAPQFGINKDKFKNVGIHIHVPEGATPKDGPSAGIALFVALASIFSKRPPRADTAMTGEITLTGRVLPIGGVKEKLLAARRSEIRTVILPKLNTSDVQDLPEETIKDLEILYVDDLDEVFQLVWHEPNRPAKKSVGEWPQGIEPPIVFSPRGRP